ncbi:MAG: UbiD family decarboxylase [Prevotellaceae bacterium]|nr:UbiD family decarboxylase [Candidatus Faecinaster equi]
MFSSIQSYIDFLERKGELLRIKEYVDPDCEIAEITSRYCNSVGEKKALLFENTGKKIKVLTNIYGSEMSLKYIFNAPSIDSIRTRFEEFIEKDKISEDTGRFRKLKHLFRELRELKYYPRYIKSTPPCQESIQYTAKLFDLPFLTHYSSDAGPCMYDAIVFSTDPDTGQRNIESVPIQILSNKTIAILANNLSNIRKHLDRATHVLPIAICIGGNPILHFLSKTNVNLDKMALLGYLRQYPALMTKCITQDINIPADSDIVIEGYIHKSSERIKAGPLSSVFGVSKYTENCPVMNVTCITHRSDAILPMTNSSHLWSAYNSFNKMTEIFITELFKRTNFQVIINISLPAEGFGQNILIVKIKKYNPIQPKIMANEIWSSNQFASNKFLIFVGEDANINETEEFARYIAARVNPNRDIYQSQGIINKNFSLNSDDASGARMMIDATNSPEHPEYRFGDVFQITFDDTFAGEEKVMDNHDKLRAISFFVDVEKDCRISNNKLIIDARNKYGSGAKVCV